MKKAITIILTIVMILSFASVAHAADPIAKDQYYGRSTLSGDELEYYDFIYNEIDAGAEKIYDYGNVGKDRARQIILCVQGDAPELINRDGMYSNEEVMNLLPLLQGSASKILNDAPSGPSEYDKVKYVYEWVTENIIYDNEAASDVNNGVDSKKMNESQTIVGGLINQEAVCSGICRTMQYLLYQLGVLSYEVTGDIDIVSDHAWLIIRVDGDWYWCDPTNYLVYDAFLMDDSFLIDNGAVINENTPPLPACTSDKYMEPAPEISWKPLSTPKPSSASVAEPTQQPTVLSANASSAPEQSAKQPFNGIWIVIIVAVAGGIIGINISIKRKKDR